MERDQAERLIAVLDRIATALEQLTSGVTNHTVNVKIRRTIDDIGYADDTVRDMELALKSENDSE